MSGIIYGCVGQEAEFVEAVAGRDQGLIGFVRLELLQRCGHEAALADAGLARDQSEAAPPAPRLAQECAKFFEFLGTSDQLRTEQRGHGAMMASGGPGAKVVAACL
jgi:hypothetical protein